MIISKTTIEGVVIIDLEVHTDDRGFFARNFSRLEFLEAGLDPTIEQGNQSFNHTAGTLRGLHFQAAPHTEAKLVRCVRGAIVDVAVDMRSDSPTRLQHVMVELSANNRRALYVPPHFAHGYQTLIDDTEVLYLVSGRYRPDAERGVRWNDPRLALEWPLPISRISAKDAALPLLADHSFSELAQVQSDPADLVT